MAKTATKLSPREHAEQTLHELEAKQAELAASRENDEAEMASVSYAAHTGDQKAEARLETLRSRAIRRDLEAKNLASAIEEAKRRVTAAKDAEGRAEEQRVAEELLELSQMMREAGKKCDKALKLLAEGSNELRKVVQATNQRGMGNPSAQQLQSLGSRAILGTIINSPYAKDFPHIAPAERKNFATFTEAWASMVERAVSAKLQTNKQEEVA